MLLPLLVLNLSGATDTTDNAAAGSYAITGAAASEIRSLIDNADAGAYSLSGVAASELRVYVDSASPGAYSVSGASALDIRSLIDLAVAGSYAITGASAADQKTFLDYAIAGEYLISGASASEIRSLIDNADAGVYSLSGLSASEEISSTTTRNRARSANRWLVTAPKVSYEHAFSLSFAALIADFSAQLISQPQTYSYSPSDTDLALFSAPRLDFESRLKEDVSEINLLMKLASLDGLDCVSVESV